ncbi:MAG: RidA family protein [Dehalococcoidia bacterium]|nr:RidA family protein [Dehalococcoidia bacterium]
MEVERKLADLGLEVSEPNPSIGNFVPAVRAGNLLFVSGNLPRLPDGSMAATGKLGREVSVDEGYAAARQCAVNCLSAARSIIGDLDKVQRVCKLLVMVNSDPEFSDQPLVGNGASDLLVELYGENGRHARSAVGMAALPRQAPVEVEMILEVAD